MNNKVIKITSAAALLAICIVSQYFKNFSVYITGPIINACLVLAVLVCGVFWGVVLAIITPFTAFLITGAPIMKAVPAIMPLIMAGNIVLVLVVWVFVRRKKTNFNILTGCIVGSVAKAAFMALTISYGVLAFVTLPEKMQPMLPTLRLTYSVTQLLTSLIGMIYVMAIWNAVKKLHSNRD